jgi:hypothetical protein
MLINLPLLITYACNFAEALTEIVLIGGFQVESGLCVLRLPTALPLGFPTTG